MNCKLLLFYEEQFTGDTHVRANKNMQYKSSSNILLGNHGSQHQSPLLETFDLNNSYPLGNVTFFSSNDSTKQWCHYRYDCPKDICECVSAYLQDVPKASGCVSSQMYTEPCHCISTSVCLHNHGYWAQRAEAHGTMPRNELFATLSESYNNRRQYILKLSKWHAFRDSCASGRRYFRFRHFASRIKCNNARKRRRKRLFPIQSTKATGSTTYIKSSTNDKIRNKISKQVFSEYKVPVDTTKDSYNEICEEISCELTNVEKFESNIKPKQTTNVLLIFCLICILLVIPMGQSIDDVLNYIQLVYDSKYNIPQQKCSRKREQQVSNIKTRPLITTTKFESYLKTLKLEQDVLLKTPSFLKLLNSQHISIYAYPLVLQSLSEYAERIASSYNMNDADGMNVELCRLLTFRNWQGSVSCMTLARLGFYYTDNDDEVICFSCNVHLNEGTNDTKPEEIHKQISPNCEMVTESDPNNVPASFQPNRSVLESHPMEVRLLDGFTETDGSVIENTLVSHGEVACGYDPKSGNGNRTDCLRKGPMHSSSTLSRYSSTCTDDTFCESRPCLETSLKDVLFPPARYNPTVTEVYLCESYNIDAYLPSGQDNFFSEIKMDDKTLGIMSDQPQNIRYALLATRIATFSTWPNDKAQTPEAVSKAGFFYAGKADIRFPNNVFT